jgi:hypothetical protein
MGCALDYVGISLVISISLAVMFYRPLGPSQYQREGKEAERERCRLAVVGVLMLAPSNETNAMISDATAFGFASRGDER